MLVLLVAVISGIAIAYFGMQNISPVTIRLNEYVWNDVPLYLVIVGSVVGWTLHGRNSLFCQVGFFDADHLWKRSRDEKNQT